MDNLIQQILKDKYRSKDKVSCLLFDDNFNVISKVFNKKRIFGINIFQNVIEQILLDYLESNHRKDSNHHHLLTTIFPNDNELLLLLRTDIRDIYILNDKDNGVDSFLKSNKDLNGTSVSLFDVCKENDINVWYQKGKGSKFERISNPTDLLSKTHINLYSDDYNGILSNYLFKHYLKANSQELLNSYLMNSSNSMNTIREDIENLIKNNQYPVLNIFGNIENTYVLTDLLKKYPELSINIYHKGFETKRFKASEASARLFVYNKNTACIKVYNMLEYTPNLLPIVNLIASYIKIYNNGIWNTEGFRFEEYKEIFGFIEYLNFYEKNFESILEKIEHDFEYYSNIVKPIGATLFLQKMEEAHSKVFSPDRLYILKVYSENHNLHFRVFQGSPSIYNELNFRMCYKKETDDISYILVEPVVSEGICNVYIKSITNRNILTIKSTATEILSKIMNKYDSESKVITKVLDTLNYCQITIPLSYGTEFFKNSMFEIL